MSVAKIDVTTATLPVLVAQSLEDNMQIAKKLLPALKRLDGDIHQLIRTVKDENSSDLHTLSESYDSFYLQRGQLTILNESNDLTNFQKKEFDTALKNITDMMGLIQTLISSSSSDKTPGKSPRLCTITLEWIHSASEMLATPKPLETHQITFTTNAKIASAVQKGFIELTEIFKRTKEELNSNNNNSMLEKLKLIEAKQKKLDRVVQNSEQLSVNQKNIFKLFFETCETPRVRFLTNWGLIGRYQFMQDVDAPDLSLDGSNPEFQITQFLDPSNNTPMVSLSSKVAIPKEKSTEEKKESRDRAPSSSEPPGPNLQRKPSLSLSSSFNRLSLNLFKREPSKDSNSSLTGEEKSKTEDAKTTSGKSKEELSPKEKKPDTFKLETKPDASSFNTPTESPKDKYLSEPPLSPPSDRSKPADPSKLRKSSVIKDWLNKGKETKANSKP